jgi:hypothetical protein
MVPHGTEGMAVGLEIGSRGREGYMVGGSILRGTRRNQKKGHLNLHPDIRRKNSLYGWHP